MSKVRSVAEALLILALLGAVAWGLWLLGRNGKLRTDLAVSAAKVTTLEESNRELVLGDLPAPDVAAAAKKAVIKEQPGARVQPISANEPAPFSGLVADHKWFAKAVACLEFEPVRNQQVIDAFESQLRAEQDRDAARRAKGIWKAIGTVGPFIGLGVGFVAGYQAAKAKGG